MRVDSIGLWCQSLDYGRLVIDFTSSCKFGCKKFFDADILSTLTSDESLKKYLSESDYEYIIDKGAVELCLVGILSQQLNLTNIDTPLRIVKLVFDRCNIDVVKYENIIHKISIRYCNIKKINFNSLISVLILHTSNIEIINSMYDIRNINIQEASEVVTIQAPYISYLSMIMSRIHNLNTFLTMGECDIDKLMKSSIGKYSMRSNRLNIGGRYQYLKKMNMSIISYFTNWVI